MIRVHIICEGQTEEAFVKGVLIPHFAPMKIILSAVVLGKPGHKGGNIKFTRMLTDVRILLLGDKDSYCTTFFDFYGLPPDFPGKESASKKTAITDKANAICDRTH